MRTQATGVARGGLIVLTGVGLALVAALLLTNGGRAPAAKAGATPTTSTGKPSVCTQSVPGRCDGATGATASAPATKRAAEVPLIEQAEKVARRYVVASGTFTGDSRAYRHNLRRLLADTSKRAGSARGLERMRARVVSSEVQYANEMGAVVLVSGEQATRSGTFLVNTNVTLTRVDGHYRVDDAQLLGGDAGA